MRVVLAADVLAAVRQAAEAAGQSMSGWLVGAAVLRLAAEHPDLVPADAAPPRRGRPRKAAEA